MFWLGFALVVLCVQIITFDLLHANRDDINAISTIFIAAFTAVLGIFTIRLASSTQVAAKAANDAAEIAQRSLTDLERPYIFIFGVRQIRHVVDDEWYVEFTVANYGKMPAIIEGAWIDFVTDNEGKPPSPTLLEEGHTLLASPNLSTQ
jgi:hypothetical protein